jgi:glutamate-ammonia-ligase adenylyltransferase
MTQDDADSHDPNTLDTIHERLERAGFTDLAAARRMVARMARGADAREPWNALLPHLLARISQSADPDGVLVRFDRLLSSTPDPARMLRMLAADPRTLELLASLFSSSQYLTEILLRNPRSVDTLAAQVREAAVKTPETLAQQARAALGAPGADRLDGLHRWHHAELLRIGACDLAGQFSLAAATGQLSALADAVVQAVLADTALQMGLSSRVDEPLPGLAVLAVGKLGGRELNYSSDIDLLLISRVDQPAFTRLGEKMIAALSGIGAAGFFYRVDMRLRPWGRAGALVPTVESHLAYLRQGAKLWEKQALIKARAIAGDAAVGSDFLHQATALIYPPNPANLREEVLAMKQRTEQRLREQGRAWGEVKLGEGSIRDIEFVVQYLQLVHGGKQPEVRGRNTLNAIRHLAQFRHLTPQDSRILADGYNFLRTVEHHLQMMHYRQTDSLPREPAALTSLARRLGFVGQDAGSQFTARYDLHTAAIRGVFLDHLGEPHPESSPAERAPDVLRHVERMDASYEGVFTAADIAHHAALAALLDADNPVQVQATALEDGRWRVTVVANDYPGELALICGLMFVHGMEIEDGNVFTYEPATQAAQNGPRKIVDVFTICPVDRTLDADTWARYRAELSALLLRLRDGQHQEARVELAKRAAESMRGKKTAPALLYPVDIEIDNQTSPRYTVLHISGTDTTGFLYELTNALAFSQVYIARVEIQTIGDRVRDTLYVTDSAGHKILAPAKQSELRAATVLIKHFTHLLPLSPDPQSALLHFHAFTGDLFRHPDWPETLASLERPEVLSALAQLLGVSDFLWDDFLRMQYANLFPVVKNVSALNERKRRPVLEAELDAALAAAGDAAWVEALNAAKDREMFRIDMRHILGYTAEFWDFSEELTDLVEVVVDVALRRITTALQVVYGRPLRMDGTACALSVCALGKCGGRELGFASDIELMFVYEENGRTGGPRPVSSAEFYEKLVETFLRSVRARREGIFEIDLQLRPYGKAGSLAVSLPAFQRYFAPGGPAWPYERQALVRLRPIAGDRAFGRGLEDLRDAYVYAGGRFDVTAMRAMRERQVRHLVKAGSFNPKYSRGGLVDVEYLVQGLQIRHGAQFATLRTPNTRAAMVALAQESLLSAEDYTRLHRAHTFLRWLIDSLRMVAGNAKDLIVPPEGSEEFSYLSRRLGYGGDPARLREELITYSASVQEMNRRLLGG